MFKKKPKKDKYEGLHGQELVDAIMRDGTLGKPVTESQARANDRKIAEQNWDVPKADYLHAAVRSVSYRYLCIPYRGWYCFRCHDLRDLLWL